MNRAWYWFSVKGPVRMMLSLSTFFRSFLPAASVIRPFALMQKGPKNQDQIRLVHTRRELVWKD
jgi:hypothetical protein